MQFAPWRTVRGRLVLAALLVEFAMLVILVGNSQRLLYEAMGEQAREQAEQIAPVLSAALVAPLAQYDYATVRAILNESQAIRGIVYLAVTDAGGDIVASSGWPANKALPPADVSYTLDGDPPRYDLALPIILAGQSLGKLQFGLDLSRIVLARKNLLTQGIFIAVSELLLTAGLLTLLGMLITRRLTLLTKASIKVAQGQLTPAPVPEGGDDVGRLGAAFNVMSVAIAERIVQLTRANAETASIAEALREKNAQLAQSHAALVDENSKRLEVQQELEDALVRIRDRTEQLNAIFDLSPDGFVSFDAQHCVKYASPSFFHMTGLDSSQIVGLAEAAFCALLARTCTEPAGFPDLAALRDRVSAENPAGNSDIAKAGGGHRRHLIELAGPGKHILEVSLRLSESETVSQILYFRDVTHESAVDRMKSEFLSHAAHELRTPMASIYGYSEILLHQQFSEKEQKEFLGIIYRQCEQMIAIINELLDLARIDNLRGKDFVFASLDANQLLQQITADFGVPAGQLPTSLDLPLTPRWVRADRNKLMQAVRNVLSNAYKYSPAGGQVEISLASLTGTGPDASVRLGIRLTDHGIGMTQEQTARVFERFYRADTSGRIAGTGLGMSIVKEIMGLHGGSVEIESQIGVGTTVILWLPVAGFVAPALV